MSLNFADVPSLRRAAEGMRGNPGLCALPATLYRDYVIEQTTAALTQPITPHEEEFLSDVCRSIDGLRGDLNRRVYVPCSTLFRLSVYETRAEPTPAADEPQTPAEAIPDPTPAADEQASPAEPTQTADEPSKPAEPTPDSSAPDTEPDSSAPADEQTSADPPARPKRTRKRKSKPKQEP